MLVERKVSQLANNFSIDVDFTHKIEAEEIVEFT